MQSLIRKGHLFKSLRMVRAFTLIELMVSIALFSIVMVTVAAAYLNMLSLDREVRATNDVSNNLNFVIDTMSRAIRTGGTYSCNGGTNCSTPASTFSFIDDQNNPIQYSLSASAPHQILECSGSGCTATAITDPRINITKLAFYVSGVGNTDTYEPFVTYVVSGTIQVDTTHAPVNFSIESSAVQRKIDI